MLGVVLAVMFFLAFFGDVFYISTSSMEPTILGRNVKGDCIVLSSAYYRLSRPRRFDVVLFHYPNNRKASYLKRLVGLGPEQLFIRGGDLYRAPLAFGGSFDEGLARGVVSILRKPDSVQEAFFDLFQVPHPASLPLFAKNRLRVNFKLHEAPGARFQVKNNMLTLEGSGLAESRGRITDALFDHFAPPGSPERGQPLYGGSQDVGDLSVRVLVQPAPGSGGSLEIRIRDGIQQAQLGLSLPVGPSGGRAILLREKKELARSSLHLQAGLWTAVRLDNVDDRLSLWVEGQRVMSADYRHAPAPPSPRPHGSWSSFSLGGKVCRLRFKNPSLRRDIYYLPRGQTRFLVPSGQALFLGDNTVVSDDSRIWGRTAIRILATGEILEGDSKGVTIEGLRPAGMNPFMEADGGYTFVDLLGVHHHFESRQEYRVLGTRPTPYVDLRDLEGRGALVLGSARRAFLR